VYKYKILIKMTSNGVANHTNMGSGREQREPEACKLFIGQVPRTWTEKELRPLFEPYGEVYELTVLHDKYTAQHKGCAFLTFYDMAAAKKAQEELHEKKTLPGSQHPMQVKPAESETKTEDRKLFIGMICKKLGEEDLRVMFSPYGTIQELTVLKNTDGVSKGCAFIKYANRLQASNAIKHMHNSQTMEGCSSAIVVKLADTDKDKLQKRMQAVATNLVGLGMNLGQIGFPNVMNGTSLQQSAYYQQLMAQLSMPNPAQLAQIVNNPGLALSQQGGQPGSMGAIVAAMANQQQGVGQLPQTPQHQHNSSSLFSSPASVNGQTMPASSYSASLAANNINGLGLPANLAGLTQMPGLGGGGLNNMSALAGVNALSSAIHQAAHPVASAATLAVPNPGAGANTVFSGLPAMPADTLQQAYSGIQQYVASFPQVYNTAFQQQVTRQPQKEGPDGANLFIYHLPQEFTDADLMQTFMPFGNVISAKVFIEKQTSLSKCFGFVSYDNQLSAQSAINSMNGFSIGSKRLKVQLKRPKDQSKPY